MKKIIVFLTVILLLALAGCGNSKADQTTVSIDKKGKVSQLIVEDFNQSYYSLEELKEMVSGAVEAYNTSQDGEKVEVKECKEDEKKGKVYLKLTYESCFDYENFNQRELYVGTVEDAQATYDFDAAFLDTEGNACDAKQIVAENPAAKVIVLQEPIAVATLSNIRYVSDNVEILGDTLAKAKSDEDSDNENADTRISDYAYIIYDGGQ